MQPLANQLRYQFARFQAPQYLTYALLCRVAHNFWLLQRLVQVGNAGEVLNLSRQGFLMKSLLVLLDAHPQRFFDVNIHKATKRATFIFLIYFWGERAGNYTPDKFIGTNGRHLRQVAPYKITIVGADRCVRPKMIPNTANLHMTLAILV